MITECPFCDSFNMTEVTVNRFFCRDCGEKWVESVEVEPSTCETCGDVHDAYLYEVHEEEDPAEWLRQFHE